MLTTTMPQFEKPTSLLTEANKVCQAIWRSPYRCLRIVSCELDNETIVLRGTVTTYYHKQLAQEIARKSSARLPVRNEITVAERCY
jgi:hypothetical protein